MEIRLVEHGSAEYEQAVDLRRRVLRIPLGLDFTDAQLDDESSDLHLCAFEASGLVGCLVLTPANPGDVKMRQVAVEPVRQGSGIGAALVARSESLGRELGFRRMILHARDTAVPFYERLGYEAQGEPFTEVGIPHLAMTKAL